MDTEKILTNSTEPLVLRPPVGSEVYGQPSLHFRQFSRSDSSTVNHNRRRRRLLLLYVLCALITLAIVAGLLFAMFVLSFGPFASSGSHAFGRQSMCRVFSPLLRTTWLESVSAADTMLNVTLSNMPQAHTYWILHLCTELLTVIRTDDRCFIRPMRAEMAEACARGYLKLVNSGHGLPDSVEAKIKDEYWYTEPPPSSTPKVIHNSLIMAWCDGVPAFRLVSRPPPSGFLSGGSPSMLDNAPVPTPMPVTSANEYAAAAAPKDPDSQEVFDQLLRERNLPAVEARRRSASYGSDDEMVRRPRAIDLAGKMGISQNQLPIYMANHDDNQQSEQCFSIGSILEDASVSSDTSSGSVVPVVRDNIYQCGL